jgi:hypothetical protein
MNSAQAATSSFWEPSLPVEVFVSVGATMRRGGGESYRNLHRRRARQVVLVMRRVSQPRDGKLGMGCDAIGKGQLARSRKRTNEPRCRIGNV